jgi:hypothetical protein
MYFYSKTYLIRTQTYKNNMSKRYLFVTSLLLLLISLHYCFTQLPSCDLSTKQCNKGVCCGTSAGGICCPFDGAVCCEGKDSCCPKGYSCGAVNGTSLCVLDHSYLDITYELPKTQIIRELRDDQSYIFDPLNYDIIDKCWEESYRTYCSYDDAKLAKMNCLRRISSGYCFIREHRCWRLKPVGDEACYKDEKECQMPVERSCSWYRNCLESKHKCGVSGYAVQYGHKYCHLFRENEHFFSDTGKKWMYKTMNCLQKSLVDVLNDPSISCDQIKQKAFDMRPDCYISSGFCELAQQRKEDVLRDIIGLIRIYESKKDLIGQNALRQIIETGIDCTTNFEFMTHLFLVADTQSLTNE